MTRKIRKVPPKDAFRDAIVMNNQTYIDYLERMKKICLSMFEWVNLPKTMNARYLEQCLYYVFSALQSLRHASRATSLYTREAFVLTVTYAWSVSNSFTILSFDIER